MNRIRIDQDILLEEINLDHTLPIYNAICENKVFLQKWLPFVNHTKKPSDTEMFIKSVSENPNNKNQAYVIYYKDEFTGLISFKDTDLINFKTEIGYWIIEKMQGKGIITKAASKLIEMAYNTMNINRIQIKVAVGNHRSAAIPKRLNFTFEGIEREGEFHTNQFFDLEIYSLLKKEKDNPSE